MGPNENPSLKEVLPVTTPSVPFQIYNKTYSQEHYLTEGNWVVYIPGTPLMLYEVTIVIK